MCKADDVQFYSKLSDNAYQFTIGNSIYTVCNEDGAEDILRSYREASIEAARLDIPEIYHDYMEFNDFADYTWQSLYDIYDVVEEVKTESNLFYICLV